MALNAKRLAPSAALLGAHIALSAAIDHEAVGASDLDPTTADLLLRLQQADGSRLRAVELCEQLLKSPSHISRIIDRAEAAGYVLRQPDPDDRRAQQVILQPAGAKAVDAVGPALDAVLQRAIYDTLSAAERDTLVTLLKRIEAGARATPGDS